MARRPLYILAWLNALLHFYGLILALLTMRPGTPLVGLSKRMEYLSGSPVGWSVGWAVWMLCVLVLVAFLAALARHLPETPATASLAVVLAVAGGTADLICDVIHLYITPRLAATNDPALFLAFERLATAVGLIVANGLYTVATLLLTLCLRGRAGTSPWLVPIGYGVFASGMTMVAAGILEAPRLTEWSTGPTILLFCVWAILAARVVERERRPA